MQIRPVDVKDSPVSSYQTFFTDIPDWVEYNVRWWNGGKIDDKEMILAIHFLANQGIIDMPSQKEIDTYRVSDRYSSEIGDMIKSDAWTWAEEKEREDNFLKGIGYLAILNPQGESLSKSKNPDSCPQPVSSICFTKKVTEIDDNNNNDDSISKEIPESQPHAFANGVTEIINPEHEPLKYTKTIPVIDDTYISKNVQQWQDMTRANIEEEYERQGSDFYYNLGKLLIANEMQYQMNKLGIVNAGDELEIIGGGTLQSNPPHIGFSTIISATDGHYYWLQGGTHANHVNYYKTTQLQYPDESEFPRIKTTPNFSEDGTIPRITITEVGGNDLKAEPYSIILPQPGNVEFYNKTPEKLTVYLNGEGVEEFSFETSLDISTRSNSGMAYPFDHPGVYSFHAKVPKNIDSKEYELNTGGAITVLGDDLSDLSQKVQMEIAKEILISSGLPITTIGQKGTDNVIFFTEQYRKLV